MKKLTLDIESLNVQSFAASPVPEPRGTVEAGALPQTHPSVCPWSRNWYCSFGECTVHPDYCTTGTL